MNKTDNVTQDCNVYSPGGSPVPAPLLWVGLVHSYCVIVFGTLGNALVLWCVVTCTKTRRPIRVLLFSVFLPVLVICLLPMPVFAEIMVGLLTCDHDRVPMPVVRVTVIILTILGQIEQVSIAAIAVVRAVTVWAPHSPQLGMRGAVLLLVGICSYAILVGLVLIKIMNMKMGTDPQTITYITTLVFINVTLPALVSAAAYILMIYVIHRNKRRLGSSQPQTKGTTSMDQATRAMLAVFISNLVFGLIHSIYHHTGKQPLYMELAVHVIFATHYIVDPLVYMWFNIGYREKILSAKRKVMHSLALLCPTLSGTQTGPTASCDHLGQHNSSRHTQDDSNV